MAVKLGNGNWAVKEDKLLAYNDNSGLFFNKEFDFSRGSTATYVGRDGLIASAASGVPRIDFTNDTKGHLLLEPSRTNLALNSNDLTESTWSKFNSSTLSSDIVNPEGASGASLYVCNNYTGSNQYFRINPNTTYSNDVNYTYSMFVKYNTFQFCKLSYMNFSVIEHFTAVFDIINGTVTATDSDGTPQNTSANIQDFGNGWFRISISAAITSSSGNAMNFEFNKSPSGTPTFTSFGRTSQTTTTNDKIYVYGAQLEEGSYATSYIPTTGAASTRNADVCNNSGSAQDFNSEEGVLYAEIAALANDGTFRQLTISDSSTSDRVSIDFTSTDNQIRSFSSSGGSTAANMTGTVTDSKQFNKVAVKYKLNDYALWINGSEVATDTSAAAPVGLQELAFDNGGGSNDFYGKVRNVQVFTEALTDEQLEKLTS